MKKIMIAILFACFAFVTKQAFTDDNPAKVEINKSKKDTGNDKEKPALRFSVTPTTMTYEGGQISVTADVLDKVPVKTVMATQIKPDGQQSAVPLSLVSGTSLDGKWQISWTMPQNNGSNPLVYGIKVRAEDASNGFAVSNTINVTVQGKPKSDVRTPQPSPGIR
jgi:hypothetical protein